jgi:uncharacterized protein YcgI (DUF1989 family)
MTRIAQDILIPAREGRAFEVLRGQRLQIIAEQGPQAADLVAFNRDDMGETLSTWLTRHLSGSFVYAERVYTALPDANLMFSVVDPRPGLLWLSAGRCNRLSYLPDHPGHENCHDILARTIAPWGLTSRQVPEVFNVFMNAQLHEDGTYQFLPSPVRAGDALELDAHLHCRVAVSACPDELGAYNEFQVRPIRIRVLDI